jgi:hypothetical protein
MSIDIKDVRRAYILARVLNVQYQFIRDFVNADLRKSINEAKAKNSHFIKQIDEKFKKHYLSSQTDNDEELGFQLLEHLEKLMDPKKEL